MNNTYSIVICTYNNSSSLRRTLGSITQLDLLPDIKLELCIINNNSNDDTESVCASFVNSITKFPVRYFFEANQGLSYARNRGAREASGNILIFTDDDVVVPQNWFSKYSETFASYDADCVFGRIIPEWGSYKPAWYDDTLSHVYGKLDYGDKLLHIDNRSQEFYGANFAIKKELLLDLGSFDVKLGRTHNRLYISEETKIFSRLINLNKSVIYNPDIFLYHVISDKMKNRRYLIKYYYDTAYSVAYLAGYDKNRQLFGIPYFRILEFIKYYSLILPKMIYGIVTFDTKGLFFLFLHFIRNTKMLALYIFSYFTRR